MAITQLKDGRWLVYYRQPRTDKPNYIKKEYFGRGPEAEAAAVKRNSELGLKKRRPPKEEGGPTVSELAKSYGNNKNFSANSKKHLGIRLQANILPFFGHLHAIQLRDQDLDNYVQYRRTCKKKDRQGRVVKTGVKNATIRRELTDLQAILNWSTRRRPVLIRFNPVLSYRAPAADNEIILPPTPDETAAILKHASPHLVRAIMLSYYLGLRPGAVELLQLNWTDINWQSKSILVRSAHKGGPVRRHVPIHEDFIEELKKWWVFDKKTGPIIYYHGKPVQKIGKAWAGTLKRAGITRRIRPYDLRHNFITQALEAGADIKALAEVVGSRPETIMRHYQHVTKKQHRKTVAKIPPLGIQNIPKKT